MKKKIILLTCCLLLAASGCRNQRAEGEEKEQENPKIQEENQEQPEETKTEKEIPPDEELSLQENSETHGSFLTQTLIKKIISIWSGWMMLSV